VLVRVIDSFVSATLLRATRYAGLSLLNAKRAACKRWAWDQGGPAGYMAANLGAAGFEPSTECSLDAQEEADQITAP
jgi:hypothetical protein